MSARTGIKSTGFTLIELMIVLVIISILLILSISTYSIFRKRAMGVEARVALSTIHKLELSYYSDNDCYTSDLEILGFKMDGPCRYNYEIISANRTGFIAEGSANLDDDADLDIWTVDECGSLTQVSTD